MTKSVEKYTPLGQLIIAEIEKINDENNGESNYTIAKLAENANISPSLFSKFLSGKRSMSLIHIMEVIVVLRCSKKAAIKLINEAGYDISGSTIEHAAEYRAIVSGISKPGWRESEEAKQCLDPTGLRFPISFERFELDGR